MNLQLTLFEFFCVNLSTGWVNILALYFSGLKGFNIQGNQSPSLLWESIFPDSVGLQNSGEPMLINEVQNSGEPLLINEVKHHPKSL